MAYEKSNIRKRVSLDCSSELKHLHKSCNVVESSDNNIEDSVMSNMGNASIHNCEVDMAGNTREPYDMVSFSSNNTDNKVDAWGHELNDDVMGIRCVDVVYSSPVASDAPHTCKELSFLHLVNQDDQILVSCSQVTDLYSFSTDQQCLVDTSRSVLHDTKLTQYQGSFGKFCYSQTRNNTIQGGSHYYTQLLDELHGVRAVNTYKYVRSFGFMLLQDVVFPQYTGRKQLKANDLVQWVKEANAMVEKSGQFIPVLCEYLEFGFPLNIDYSIFYFNSDVKNHASALRNAAGVDKYFVEEVTLGAMIGPLDNSPFKKNIILL